MTTISSPTNSHGHGSESLYALLGMLAISVGLATALFLMPNDPRPSGAMFWPALALTLGLLTVPALRVRSSIRSMLRSEHILLLALVYWLLLDPLQSAYPLHLVTYDSVATAMIAIATLAFGIWIGTLGLGWRLPKVVQAASRLSLSSSALYLAIWITFFLGMFHFALSSGFDVLVMINGLSAPRFSAPWDRGAIGDWRAFTEVMTSFGFIVPSLTVSLAHKRGWRQPSTIISIVLSLIIVMFLTQHSGRRVIGIVIGAALINWLMIQQRLRPRLIIVSLTLVMLLLAGMQEILEYRASGFKNWLSGKTAVQTYAYLHIDDNLLRLSQITELFPRDHPYLGLQPLIYVLVRPIPRVFWSDKPVNPGYDLTGLIRFKGSRGTTLTTSVVGELYVMYGLLAIFLGGIFYGRLARTWNKVLDTSRGAGSGLLYGLGIMVLFVAVRSMQDLVVMGYGLLAWLVVSKLFSLRNARRTVFGEIKAALPVRGADF